jgi:hypothetical protein
MRKSLGVHITDITNPQDIVQFLKSVFIGQILYTFSITTIKLSVLAFYWRLFEIKARITIYVITAMSISWCIAIVRPSSQLSLSAPMPHKSSLLFAC